MIATLVTVGLMTSQPPERQPDQWYCGAFVEGSRNSSMNVSFYVESDGKLVGQGVIWTPPLRAKQFQTAALTIALLDMSASYDNANQSGIGQPTSVGVSALSEGSLNVLDEGSATLKIRGLSNSTASFDVTGEHPAYRSATIADSDDHQLLAALENASIGEVTVQDKSGALMASMTYDLAARRERDRLFHRAWREARRKLAHPTQCDKTSVGGDRTLNIPIPDVPIP